MQRLALVAISLGCACSNSGTPMLKGFDPGAAPDNGRQIIMPITKDIQPGQSLEMCTYTGIEATDVESIKSITGFQAAGGHHISLYSTTIEMPPWTARECSDSDMANFRLVAATGGEGDGSTTTENTGGVNAAPGDLVYQIPEGSFIAINEHFINATDSAIDSQSALDIQYADPTQTYTPSHGAAFLDDTFDLPPGPSSVDVNCTVNQDYKIWQAIPHMHNYGSKFTVTHTHGGVTDTMFDVEPWDPTYMFHPPEMNWDPTTPQMFNQGDTIKVHCEWDNTTSNDLFFGDEMCVFFTQYVDDTNTGNLACDNGSWGTF